MYDQMLFRLASGNVIRGGFVSNNPDGPAYWCVWMYANQTFTVGTYLRLYVDGTRAIHILHDDGTEDVVEEWP